MAFLRFILSALELRPVQSFYDCIVVEDGGF